MIFVFWYNIDFLICGSLKFMCMVVGFHLIFFKKKNLILRVGRPSKKGYCTFIPFKFFKGCQFLIKIKHLFWGSCRLLKFQFQGARRPEKFPFQGNFFKGHQGLVKPRAFNTFFKGFDPQNKSTLFYKLIYMERSNAVSFLGYGYVYGWVWELLGRQTYVDDECISSSFFFGPH